MQNFTTLKSLSTRFGKSFVALSLDLQTKSSILIQFITSYLVIKLSMAIDLLAFSNILII